MGVTDVILDKVLVPKLQVLLRPDNLAEPAADPHVVDPDLMRGFQVCPGTAIRVLLPDDRTHHVATVSDNVKKPCLWKEMHDHLQATLIKGVGIVRVLVSPVPRLGPHVGIKTADQLRVLVAKIFSKLSAVGNEESILASQYLERLVQPGEQTHLMADKYVGMCVQKLLQIGCARAGGTEDNDWVVLLHLGSP
jgi:hypothetical protein